MDTTKTITHIGLCAGYGGIELGLKRVLPTLQSVALCEIEAFPIANLVAKMEAGLMEPAPIWTDLKTFPWESFRDRVDILTGGYPCQPFSAAGKRAGKEDPRHLWPWIADGLVLMRPRLVFFENVEGHISLGLREVIGDLESLGYKTAWGIFSASEVGAPHQRKRVFILANLSSKRLEGATGTSVCRCISGSTINAGISWPSRPGEPQHGWEPPRVVGNAESRQDNGREPRDMGEASSSGGCCDHAADRAGEGLGHADSPRPQERSGQRGEELQGAHANGGETAGGQTQPTLGGDTDGSSGRMDYAELYTTCDNRTDELRLLGNGVVPATAERAFRTLLNELYETQTHN